MCSRGDQSAPPGELAELLAPVVELGLHEDFVALMRDELPPGAFESRHAQAS